MISKISSIDNFAVFNDFQWDTSVVDGAGQALRFEKINVLYGRNYSGKTTLSRILRALETKTLPDKYADPKFEITFNDCKTINQDTIDENETEIRVFNEDFVRDNLSFLNNPDGKIAPIAILGSENIEVERAITEIESILGSSEEGKESGLYEQFKIAENEKTAAKKDHETAMKELSVKLSNKANEPGVGIKFKYNEPNYNINSVQKDIEIVLNSGYVALGTEERKQHENTIREQVKEVIPAFICPQLSFEEYCQQSSELLSRNIGATNKIRDLFIGECS